MKLEIQRMARFYPEAVKGVRGLGFMIGLELAPKEPLPALAASDKPAAAQVVNRLHAVGMLTVPSGNQVIRLLPHLNLTQAEAQEAMDILEKVVREIRG